MVDSRQAVIYARVSSKEQEREGYSIPAQLDLLRRYAQQNGFNVLHEFSEAETAKKAGRDQFTAMVSFLKKRKMPTAILVEKTDRLLRNLDDYVLIENVVRQCNTEIHKVKENMVINRNSQSFEIFVDGLNVLLARRYIHNLSEEVRKGKRQKVLEGGYHTKAPYGYRNDKNTKQIIINPDQAPFVIRAFQIYATGLYSLEATINKLDKEGFKYRPAIRRISLSPLERMLKNPAYIGKVPFEDQVYDGKHTPLIDADTWRLVQLAFRKDAKPTAMTKHDFLYRGMLTCGECASAIVGETKKGKYTYYRCSGIKRGCSQKVYVSESRITETVEGVLSGLKFPEDAKRIITEGIARYHGEVFKIGQQERGRLEGQLTKLHNKRRTIYEDKLAGVIDVEMYQSIDQECLQSIQDLEVQKSKITEADTDYRMIADLAVELPEILQAEWFQADMEDRKEILNFMRSNFFLMGGNPHLVLHPVFNALRETNEILKSRK